MFDLEDEVLFDGRDVRRMHTGRTLCIPSLESTLVRWRSYTIVGKFSSRSMRNLRYILTLYIIYILFMLSISKDGDLHVSMNFNELIVWGGQIRRHWFLGGGAMEQLLLQCGHRMHQRESWQWRDTILPWELVWMYLNVTVRIIYQCFCTSLFHHGSARCVRSCTGDTSWHCIALCWLLRIYLCHL